MTKANQVLVCAGEESGDILGAAILEEYQKKHHDQSFFGFGGSRMQAAGVEILKTTDDLATVGFWEAIKNYRRLKKILLTLVADAISRKTQLAVLIDFPGFNLRLAQELHKVGIESILVVSPQIWAWHYSRIKKIRKYIKSVFCLYEFEVAIYNKEKVNAQFIGHPMVDLIVRSKKNYLTNGNPLQRPYKKKVIALLPGSRRSEVSRHFDFLLRLSTELKKKYPTARFLVPVANDAVLEIMQTYSIPDYFELTVGSHAVLDIADIAIACSGTATTECAAFDVPFLLIYNVSKLTYAIGKRIVRIPYIGMTNIICGKFAVKEFIQNEMTIEKVFPECVKLIEDEHYRSQLKNDFKTVHRSIGNGGAAKKASALLKIRIKMIDKTEKRSAIKKAGQVARADFLAGKLQGHNSIEDLKKALSK